MSESKYYGIYQGIVTNIKDPEKRGRIRAVIPDVTGESESSWCEPCFQNAVDFSGDVSIPKVQEAVWVSFIGGDSNRPVYIGGWWSENSTPFGILHYDELVESSRIIEFKGSRIVMTDEVLSIEKGDSVVEIYEDAVLINGSPISSISAYFEEDTLVIE